MAVYSYSEALEVLGRNVINSTHTDLADVRVEFLFRDKASTSRGREVWGKARKVTGLAAFFAVPKDDAPQDIEDAPDIDPFFVIEIAHDIWQVLTAQQRIALLDHELSHCHIRYKDGEAALDVVDHDISEFEGVVRRHGLWKADVASFAKVGAEYVENTQLALVEEG